jgi:regulator of protease activity HflC (stomatin/prohibitin superfamily)
MKKIFPLFAVIIVLVLAICSFHIIPTGYTGVKTSFGQIQETTIQSGKLNFCIPFVQSIHKVNNKQQDKHIEAQVWGEASDKTPVYAADVIVTYQVLPEKSAWLYANVSDIKNLVGDELVASAIKSAMAELGPNEVTNRTKIEPLAQQKLAESLVQKYGEDVVFVNKVVVNDMNFEDAYNEAIQQKSIAQQNADRRSRMKPPLPRQKRISRWRSPMQRRKPRKLPLPQMHRQRQTANWQKACPIR